jgi:hypothetical protein
MCKEIIVIVFIFSITKFQSTGQSFANKSDFTNFLLTYKILSTGNTNFSDSLINLPSTQRLIKQCARFDKEATSVRYIEELLAAVRNEKLSRYSFRFHTCKGALKQFEVIYRHLQTNQDSLNQYLHNNLVKYLNPKDVLNTEACFLLGGTSDGFANGNIFCVDLAFFNDDIEGFKLLTLHEMFHIVQSFIKPENHNINLNNTTQKINNLFTNVLNEGSASFIANPLLINQPGTYNKCFQGKYRLNLNRIKDNFQLFESMLIRLHTDSIATFEDIYAIGFSGRWESPLYYVGFVMCELMQKYEGDTFLNKYLRDNPLKFIKGYIKYSTLENMPSKYPLLGSYSINIINKIVE